MLTFETVFMDCWGEPQEYEDSLAEREQCRNKSTPMHGSNEGLSDAKAFKEDESPHFQFVPSIEDKVYEVKDDEILHIGSSNFLSYRYQEPHESCDLNEFIFTSQNQEEQSTLQS